MIQYLLGFLAVLVACVALQSAGLRAVGGKTTKCESNYFSSIARMQSQAMDRPEVVLLGSSMTGRLADRAVPVSGIGNIGCDGGSAVVTLRAIDRGELPLPAKPVIEANTLAYELDGRGGEMGGAVGRDWFKVGVKVPQLSATARPTAFAYSWLITKKDGVAEVSSDLLPITSKPRVLSGVPMPELSSEESALVEQIVAMLDRQRERGAEPMLLVLPPGLEMGSREQRVADAVAIRSGVSWWDLTDGLPEDAVGFTDGIHMDTPSVGKTMATIAAETLPRN